MLPARIDTQPSQRGKAPLLCRVHLLPLETARNRTIRGRADIEQLPWISGRSVCRGSQLLDWYIKASRQNVKGRAVARYRLMDRRCLEGRQVVQIVSLDAV
jgi:hypothetical protein